jgi:hypothetical protein
MPDSVQRREEDAADDHQRHRCAELPTSQDDGAAIRRSAWISDETIPIT